MVVFRPFRGWRYNSKVVGDLARVVCPPYDLITPQLQESLLQQSPYNVVHLEAGEGLDWNAPVPGQYQGTSQLFDDWIQRGVLLRDQDPYYYLLKHDFSFQDQRLSRLGLTGCVGLEEYEAQQVFPHEYTEEPAIRDRVSLMEACNANFSPIMALYKDSGQYLRPVFREVMGAEPDIQIRADSNQDLALWRIGDPGLQNRIHQFFTDTRVFLADGHHRYEAALRFRKKQSSWFEEPIHHSPAHNFIMMTLIEFDDPGLLVLPYHRIVGGLPQLLLAQVQERLRQIFDVQPVDLATPDTAAGLLSEVLRAGTDAKVLGLFGLQDKVPYLLTLRDDAPWRDWGPLAISDAWILEEQVLKPVLADDTSEYLNWVHDHHDAVDRVITGESQMAFLLKPFPMGQFEDVVGEGQRLPPKSTFFYPKLPTGLVINQLDETASLG